MRDQKKEGKNLKKLRKLLSDQLMSQHASAPLGSNEVEWDTLPEVDQDDQEDASKAPKLNKDKEKGEPKAGTKKVVRGGKIVIEPADGDDAQGEDDIPVVKVKASKNAKQKEGKNVTSDEQDNDDGEDEVMNVNKGIKKNKKKGKKRKASEVSQEKSSDNKAGGSSGELPKKRVHFDLSQNKVTEFFKHGKVAQRLLVD